MQDDLVFVLEGLDDVFFDAHNHLLRPEMDKLGCRAGNRSPPPPLSEGGALLSFVPASFNASILL